MGQLAALLELGQASEILRERAAAAALPLSDAERRVLPLVLDASYRTGIEPALILALMWHESAHTFDPRSINYQEPKGGPSVGLMQVQLATGRGALGDPRLTLEQLFDPRTNVRAGTTYLATQLRRYRGDVAAALAAYNAGTAYRRRDGSGYVNQRYVDQVLGRLAYYRGAGLPAPPAAARVGATAARVAPWVALAGVGALGVVAIATRGRMPA